MPAANFFDIKIEVERRAQETNGIFRRCKWTNKLRREMNVVNVVEKGFVLVSISGSFCMRN